MEQLCATVFTGWLCWTPSRGEFILLHIHCIQAHLSSSVWFQHYSIKITPLLSDRPWRRAFKKCVSTIPSSNNNPRAGKPWVIWRTSSRGGSSGCSIVVFAYTAHNVMIQIFPLSACQHLIGTFADFIVTNVLTVGHKNAFDLNAVEFPFIWMSAPSLNEVKWAEVVYYRMKINACKKASWQIKQDGKQIIAFYLRKEWTA